jgi:SM-20-related protein
MATVFEFRFRVRKSQVPASRLSITRGASGNHAPSTGPAGSRACPFLVLEDFLLPGELELLLRHTLSHAGDFETAGVVVHHSVRRTVQKKSRRAHVLWNAGKIGGVIRKRVRSYLPWILEGLGIRPFRVARIEAQITASNHGDFFRKHMDNSDGVHRRRVVSYVYYFHRTPRRFAGGELLLYPTWHEDGRVVFATKARTIAPSQNRIVFFASSALHEIRTIRCPSGELADSRFTVNGWVSR